MEKKNNNVLSPGSGAPGQARLGTAVPEAAILGGGVAAAYAADRQGWIDTAESVGNDATRLLADQYHNNSTGSLGGLLAEADFVRSFNIRAAEAGYSGDAFLTRLGSHDLNSADIQAPWGELFQPKFYSTPAGSARAISEIVEVDGELVNRYAGQTLLVPTDQLDDVRGIMETHASEAIAAGDVQTAALLQDSLSRLSDRITSPDGSVQSDAFSYAETHRSAESTQADLSIDMGDGFNAVDSGVLLGENALLAGGLSAGVGLASVVVSAVDDLWSGRLTATEFAGRTQQWFRDQGKGQMMQGAGRSVLSATLASTEELDPTGAVVLATLIWDLAGISKGISTGQISTLQAVEQVTGLIKKKIPTVLVTSLAVAQLGIGPGIAVAVVGELLIREVIRNDKVKIACLQSLSAMQEEMERAGRAMAEQADIQDRSLVLASQGAAAARNTSAMTASAVRASGKLAETAQASQQSYRNLSERLAALRKKGTVE